MQDRATGGPDPSGISTKGRHEPPGGSGHTRTADPPSWFSRPPGPQMPKTEQTTQTPTDRGGLSPSPSAPAPVSFDDPNWPIPPESLAALTSVQPKETSLPSDSPTTYRGQLLVHISPGEIDAARSLYSAWPTTGTSRLPALNSCRTYARFAQHTSTGKVIVLSSHCRLRWCPLCARSRSFEIQTKLTSWLHSIRWPAFITFTLRHSNAP